MRFETRPWIKIKGMSNWEIIKRTIKEQEIRNQHFTTSTKLHTASDHLIKLAKMIPTKKITDLPIKIELDEQKKSKITYLPDFKAKAQEYLEEFDGFFYSLRGCLDSFFWETNLIFKLGLDKISLRKVKCAMKEKHNGKATTRLIERLENEKWFRYMTEIRNELTHHTISQLVTFTEDFMIYLPRDPTGNLYFREARYEVLTCLKALADETLVFLEKGYDTIINDLGLSSRA